MTRPATRVGAALVALTLLAGCSTTVSGSGRYAGPAPTASGSGTGTASGGASANDIWQSVRDAVVALPAVSVSGEFAGAGFGPGANGTATIEGSYGTKDGDPLADVTVTTDGATLEVRAVGGSAWIRGGAPLLTAYGYDATVAAKAADRWVLSTDDDAGLDAFASLAAFLQICAPDSSTSDLTATAKGSGEVVLASELEDGSVTVTTDPPRLTSSVFSGDDLTFDYPSSAPTVTAPAAADVVTLPDF